MSHCNTYQQLTALITTDIILATSKDSMSTNITEPVPFEYTQKLAYEQYPVNRTVDEAIEMLKDALCDGRDLDFDEREKIKVRDIKSLNFTKQMTHDELLRNADIINWDAYTYYNDFTEIELGLFKPYINFNVMSKKPYSLPMLRIYMPYLHTRDVTCTLLKYCIPGITGLVKKMKGVSIAKRFSDQSPPTLLQFTSQTQSLAFLEEFLEEFKDKINWNEYSKHIIPDNQLETYRSYIDWHEYTQTVMTGYNKQIPFLCAHRLIDYKVLLGDMKGIKLILNKDNTANCNYYFFVELFRRFNLGLLTTACEKILFTYLVTLRTNPTDYQKFCDDYTDELKRERTSNPDSMINDKIAEVGTQMIDTIIAICEQKYPNHVPAHVYNPTSINQDVLSNIAGGRIPIIPVTPPQGPPRQQRQQRPSVNIPNSTASPTGTPVDERVRATPRRRGGGNSQTQQSQPRHPRPQRQPNQQSQT